MIILSTPFLTNLTVYICKVYTLQYYKILKYIIFLILLFKPHGCHVIHQSQSCDWFCFCEIESRTSQLILCQLGGCLFWSVLCLSLLLFCFMDRVSDVKTLTYTTNLVPNILILTFPFVLIFLSIFTLCRVMWLGKQVMQDNRI